MAKPKTFATARPNAGIEAAYQKRLDRLVQEMVKSTKYWIRAAYRANPPEMAQDASPAATLREIMRRLAKRWQKRFDETAPALASYFAQSVATRTDKQLESILKKGGFSVDYKMTRTVNDIVQASIAENVNLIKSIPEQYFTQIQGIVMRNVQTGGNLKQMTDEIEARYGVTRRRAKFIASDQNSKACSAINRARLIESGVEQAQWRHSQGGNHKRPSHVKASADKVIYNVKEGWFDPDVSEFIQPGFLPGCRCFGRAVWPD